MAVAAVELAPEVLALDLVSELMLDFELSEALMPDLVSELMPDFEVSVEDAAGGVEVALEPALEDDGEDWAKAVEIINPLTAVVTNNFFNIGGTSMHGCIMC